MAAKIERCLLWLVTTLVLSLIAFEASAQGFKPYLNDKFKFAFEVPAHWVTELKKTESANALIFSGPKGSPEYFTTINVQIVFRTPETSLEDQIAEIIRQWSSAPRFKLISKERGRLAGQPAVRLVARYQLAGTKDMYGQEQYLTERGEYYYWIGYTAPLDMFERYRWIMDRSIASFRFLP